jgi:hypothetical protein
LGQCAQHKWKSLKAYIFKNVTFTLSSSSFFWFRFGLTPSPLNGDGLPWFCPSFKNPILDGDGLPFVSFILVLNLPSFHSFPLMAQ